MDVSTLRLLDQALFFLHAALVLFILTGWMWQRIRRLHLLVVGLTLASWVGLGAWYGWGYCPMTDWHWQAKAALGETALPASYIKYYADELTGQSWDPLLVDAWVVGLTLTALVLSAVLNGRDWRRQRGRHCKTAAGSRDPDGVN